MAYKVIIRDEADKDAQEAYDYYEQQQPCLGQEFLMALVERYDDLEKYPQNYGYIDTQLEKILRDTKIRRFPYVIIFEISENTEVIVYAIHNTRKKPSARLRKI
jgi:mRNA-degrading endonuclease RelE of RelBE toxin-antitoxin system